jgi:type II secretion system protein L
MFFNINKDNLSMADFLLIHINNQFDITQVISYDKVDNTARQIPVEQLNSVRNAKTELILLLPASWVYLTTTHIASRSSDILEKSIPYSVEDELVNDVGDNYYAWKILSEQKQSVAVVSKNKRHQINDFIQQQQLPVSAIYSEAVFCPAHQNQLTLWQDNDRVLLRFGLDTAMVTTLQQAPQLVSTFGQECQQLLTNNPDAIDGNQFNSVSDLALADCCAYLLADNEVNLYRGQDRDSEQQQKPLNWIKPMLAAAVLLVSWVFVNIYQGWHLSADISELKQQQQNILKDKFGNLSATEQRDPFAAMQSRLQQVNNQNQPSNLLLDGMHYLGEARRKQQNIELKGIRLFDNNMEIQVTAPTISDINNYRQVLQNLATNYRVNIGVNELTDGVYQSILTMKPR